ncbi:MAG: hypothetical protein ACKV19_14405 [Verrucomicrobiales bacterium]
MNCPSPYGFNRPRNRALLDKVASQGLHSLTDAQCCTLAAASNRYQGRK